MGLGSSWGGKRGEKRRQARGFSNSGGWGLPGAPLADISHPPMEETHITPVEVPSTLVVPLVASSLQPLEAMSNAEKSVPTTNVD